MASEIRIFGIRHHGPGSARRLLEALDGLRPALVLIEGPADASELLALLADDAMVPPVALLTYAADDPGRAIFWPFASYSPEYQAARWAVRNGAEARFIDIPASWRLVPAQPIEAGQAPKEDTPSASEPSPAAIERDPIGVLAAAGGYEDGESWWRDVIEENPEPSPVFAAIAEAMSALREAASPPEGQEALREAHMRREIAKAAKETEGAVAVVCGAWHAPALEEKVGAAADRALLKGRPGRRSSRPSRLGLRRASPSPAAMARASRGPAGARICGDATPRDRHALARALAALLRTDGHLVSTASLIEAERLAVALAALRDRPAPGFGELREAAVACLCFGETLLWRTISQRLLLGAEVGSPGECAAAPLLEDLAREQKRLRLKPEALDRELALDLRSESGAERSTLLHRLVLLGVPWGRLADAGRSRGLFGTLGAALGAGVRRHPRREPRPRPTIAQAAAGRLRFEFEKANELKALPISFSRRSPPAFRTPSSAASP